jgi:uncharacterized membrane protein YeaQ/YmgE (transglycosylase-associated protein family)
MLEGMPSHVVRRGLMLVFTLAGVVVGTLVGLLARYTLPSATPMGVLSTSTLGVTGALAGGFLAFLLLGSDVTNGHLSPMGLTGFVVGAVVTLISCWLGARSTAS